MAIPYPLFDRMEIISFLAIQKMKNLILQNNFLIPKTLKEYDFNSKSI